MTQEKLLSLQEDKYITLKIKWNNRKMFNPLRVSLRC